MELLLWAFPQSLSQAAVPRKAKKGAAKDHSKGGKCVCMCLCKSYKTTSMTGGLLKIIKQHNCRTLKDYMAENNIFQITFKI